MTIPAFLPYFVFTGTAVTLVAILYGLHRSLVEAGWPEADRARTFRASSALLLGWLAVTIVLGALGVYHVSSNEIPTIQYGILLPILAGALLIWRSETAKRVVAAVPQSWLVGVQLYRALGVIFLILYATGKLPSLFAWPAGIGDIAIGLLAPIVGLPMRERRTTQRPSWRAGTYSVFSISSSRSGPASPPRPRSFSPSRSSRRAS